MIAPKERILCVCRQGDNRSVHAAWLLKKHGKEAIAVGVDETSVESFKILQDWADRVIVLDKVLWGRTPKSEKNELVDIGPDIYPRPLNKELIDLLERSLFP